MQNYKSKFKKIKEYKSTFSILHFVFCTLNSKRQQGMGIVEIVVAMGIMLIIATTGASILLQGFRSNTLADDETKASFFAQEGIEAVRSIKNRSWPLPTGTFGLANGSGSWQFSGSSNTDGKFTRQVIISDVQRDGSGNIVATGGTLDSNTKKVRSRVAWTTPNGRSATIDLPIYHTYWEQPVKRGGLLVYGDNSGLDDVVDYKVLSGLGVWGNEQTLDMGVPLDRDLRRVDLYSSPTRNEKIMITKHVEAGAGNDTYLYAAVWNGATSTWGNIIQLSSWAAVTTPEVRNYDGDYLANGNFMLVYDNNSNIPQYTQWTGSGWSSAASTLNVGGNPEWIVVRNRPGTNEVMVGIYDAGNDTNTIRWTGSAWANLTEHATAGTGASYQNVDFAWSSNTTTTGALIYNEAADNFPNIRVWNGTTWSSAVENIDIGGVTRSMQIVARAGANEFLACFKDSAADINCMKSAFTPSWTNLSERAINNDTDTQRSFDVAYETLAGNPALLVYSNGVTDTDKRIPKYTTFNPSTNVWTAESALAALGADGTDALETVRVIPDPLGDDLMVVMGSSNQDVWSAVWDGTTGAFYSSGGKAQTEHGLNGSFDTDQWFDFAWDRL